MSGQLFTNCRSIKFITLLISLKSSYNHFLFKRNLPSILGKLGTKPTWNSYASWPTAKNIISTIKRLKPKASNTKSYSEYKVYIQCNFLGGVRSFEKFLWWKTSFHLHTSLYWALVTKLVSSFQLVFKRITLHTNLPFPNSKLRNPHSRLRRSITWYTS